MCSYCATYEHSRSCGDQCEDHLFEHYEPGSDEEDIMYRCSRCGSCKVVEVGDVAS